MNKTARDYQDACITAIRDAFVRKLRGVIVELFTGAGKGYIIARIAELARLKQGRVLVLVNRDNLCEQLFQSVAEQGLFPQMERGMDKASVMSEMVIGSIQTMQGERLKRWPKDHFKMVITDEVHFGAAKTFLNTLNYFQSAWHVGLSATIQRHDGRGIWKGYQECVFSMPLTEGINHGWLVPFEFVELPVPIVIDDMMAKKKGWTEEDESEVFRKELYLPRLYEASAQARGNLKSLFFWPNCDASKDATAYFQSIGLKARHIDGYQTRTEQATTLEWFKATPDCILSNADLLSYGYDNPSIQCIGIMRLSKSLPMLKQRLGRGTRPSVSVDSFVTAEERVAAIAASTKPNVRVLDLMLQLGDIHNSFAVPSDLITEDEEEREFLRKGRKPGEAITMEELAAKLKTKRETDKDKQLAKLAEDAANAARKIKHEGPYIDDILNRADEGIMWSDKQRRYLWVLGFRKRAQMSNHKASMMINRYIKWQAKEKQNA